MLGPVATTDLSLPVRAGLAVVGEIAFHEKAGRIGFGLLVSWHSGWKWFAQTKLAQHRDCTNLTRLFGLELGVGVGESSPQCAAAPFVRALG